MIIQPIVTAYPCSMPPLIQCFPPVVNQSATVLILGSMPGMASLAANQYYAHPRNAFWPIMGNLLQFAPETAYVQRLQILQNAGIALWDVLQSCERSGSLDTSIVASTRFVNDFAGFLRDYSSIRYIFFNGGRAYTMLRRYSSNSCLPPHLCFTRLPSTSPAHARMTFAQKLTAWQVVLDVVS
ncbi:MAG TPA: DNA-deoxyinosine glycosylase [Nitrosomonas mobilis]|nr:DNA-deoxyinosine glycosylase [Nitrosomonas mobilis]